MGAAGFARFCSTPALTVTGGTAASATPVAPAAPAALGGAAMVIFGPAAGRGAFGLGRGRFGGGAAATLDGPRASSARAKARAWPSRSVARYRVGGRPPRT